MNTTNKEIKEKEERLLSFKKEIEGLHDITDAEEYAKQLAHLFLGNGLSLQTILLMAIDFGQQHPQWIPVEERLPEENQRVRAWSLENNEEYLCDYHDSIFEDFYSPFTDGKITHWMPIVPPRKEDKE